MSRTLIHHPPPNRMYCGRVGIIATLSMLAIGGVALAPKAAKAQTVSVTTLLSGTTYSVSIVNNTLVELGEVDFTFTSDPILTNLSSPTGFDINYDQPSGSLVFFEDTGEFSPGSTVSPFTFQSTTPIIPSVVEGLNDNGNALTPRGSILFPTASGQTRTTLLAVAPEPGSLSLLGLGLVPGLAFVKRVRISRRRIATRFLKG